jgi:hypothetical protein
MIAIVLGLARQAAESESVGLAGSDGDCYADEGTETFTIAEISTSQASAVRPQWRRRPSTRALPCTIRRMKLA